MLLFETAAPDSPHGVPADLRRRPRVVRLVSVAPPRGAVAPPRGAVAHPRGEVLGRLRRGKLLQPLGRRSDLDGGNVADVVVVGVQFGEVAAAVLVGLVEVGALPGDEGDLDGRVGRPLVPDDAWLVLVEGGERRGDGVEDRVGGGVVQGAAQVGRGVVRPRRGGLPPHACSVRGTAPRAEAHAPAK